MSKAERMFEELGYGLTREDGNYLVYVRNDNFNWVISFNLRDKKYNLELTNYFGDFQKFIISYKLHEAITQQMKELGWI